MATTAETYVQREHDSTCLSLLFDAQELTEPSSGEVLEELETSWGLLLAVG